MRRTIGLAWCAVALACGEQPESTTVRSPHAQALSRAPADSPAPVYTVGIIPQFAPEALAEIWLPLLAELGQRTGHRFKMVGAPEIPAFEAAFNQGAFDFAYMNPYHAVSGNVAQGYEPIVRDHGRQLYGLVVVRADSDIATMEDLRGQTVAFPAPNALGASLMIRADLDRRLGVEIQPSYVQTHTSVYLNVVLGKAAAGGGVSATLQAQPQEVRQALRVLYETERLPTHPIVAHPRVPPAVVASVREAFLAMGETEQGRAMLAGVPLLEPGPATTQDYQPLAALGLDAYYVPAGSP